MERKSLPSVPQIVNLKLSGENNPPVIISSPTREVIVGQDYIYQAIAEDADNDQLIWSLKTYPSGMRVDSDSGKVTWEPNKYRIGTNEVELKVSDENGGEDIQSFIIYVKLSSSGNSSPEIVSIPETNVEAGSDYEYQVLVHDPDGDPVNYNLVEYPSGMIIDASGLVSWQVPGSNGLIESIHIMVDDGKDGYDHQIFNITIGTLEPEVTNTPAPTRTFTPTFTPTSTRTPRNTSTPIVTFTLVASWTPTSGPTIVGDINNDGEVDVTDLFLMSLYYYTYDPSADIENNGIVDKNDLLKLISNWH